MAINSEVRNNQNILEYGKFVEIVNDSNFPPLSTTRTKFRDDGSAYSETLVYPKYALLTYDIGTGGVNGTPFGDNASSDSFGRLRVSEPDTQLDAKLLYGKSSTLFDEALSGTATSTHSAFDACVYMRTSSANDFVIRQTRQSFNYQPGKSIQALMTGVFSSQTNVIKRVGLFTGSTSVPYNPIDGIYLENNSGVITLNVIKTQGTVSTQSVPQSAWNVDKLDGTGASKITIDFTKTQIFVLDYEWLGVGRVRAGFVIDGKTYYAHYFNNANKLSAAYMTSPNHHVRYEIRQTGPGSGIMQQICCSVMTEGGEDNVGSPFSIDSGGLINNYDTTLRPLLGMKRNVNYRNLVIQLQEIAILASNTNSKFGIYLNPTITGGSLNYNLSSNGIVYALGSNSLTLSGGTCLYQGVVQKDNTTGNIFLSNKCHSFGESINGTQDELVIGIQTYSGSNGNFGVVANFLERA